MRELLIAKLEELRFPSDKFSLYSLRAGGVTAAATERISDRDFHQHGNWKLESAKNGYIEDPIAKRLKVSQALGL